MANHKLLSGFMYTLNKSTVLLFLSGKMKSGTFVLVSGSVGGPGQQGSSALPGIPRKNRADLYLSRFSPFHKRMRKFVKLEEKREGSRDLDIVNQRKTH